MTEDPLSWTAHATIAKKSAAISSFKSISEFKRNRDALSITNDLVYRVMSSLYGGDMNYYFGDYLFSEIELNEMKLDDDGYYVTPQKVPIYAQSPISPPPSFHPIQKPVIVEERQTTVLPERHSTLCDCPQCHLHFSSERQLKRHMRIHSKEDAAHASPASVVEEPAQPAQPAQPRPSRKQQEGRNRGRPFRR